MESVYCKEESIDSVQGGQKTVFYDNVRKHERPYSKLLKPSFDFLSAIRLHTSQRVREYEIAASTKFVFDGTKDLLIILGGSGGWSINKCSARQ